jgi:16S rRNA (cytosine1402-N4)-methyltransferase
LAGRIASAIVETRERQPIETTAQLAAVIAAAVPARVAAGSCLHPATRSFQAIRIHINDELDELAAVLKQSLAALAPGGRLVAISFHSLEDRIVKRFLRNAARPEPPPVPMARPRAPKLRLIGKPRRATPEEVAANPRARSAILRVAERTGDGT